MQPIHFALLVPLKLFLHFLRLVLENIGLFVSRLVHSDDSISPVALYGSHLLLYLRCLSAQFLVVRLQRLELVQFAALLLWRLQVWPSFTLSGCEVWWDLVLLYLIQNVVFILHELLIRLKTNIIWLFDSFIYQSTVSEGKGWDILLEGALLLSASEELPQVVGVFLQFGLSSAWSHESGGWAGWRFSFVCFIA